MSAADDMRAALATMVGRQDASIMLAAQMAGVSPAGVTDFMATIQNVRSTIADPLFDKIDLLDKALTDACEHVSRLASTLDSALEKLKFFDILKQSGGMLNVDAESINELAEWRAKTAGWLDEWFRDVLRQQQLTNKANDGQGD